MPSFSPSTSPPAVSSIYTKVPPPHRHSTHAREGDRAPARTRPVAISLVASSRPRRLPLGSLSARVPLSSLRPRRRRQPLVLLRPPEPLHLPRSLLQPRPRLPLRPRAPLPVAPPLSWPCAAGEAPPWTPSSLLPRRLPSLIFPGRPPWTPLLPPLWPVRCHQEAKPRARLLLPRSDPRSSAPARAAVLPLAPAAPAFAREAPSPEHDRSSAVR